MAEDWSRRDFVKLGAAGVAAGLAASSLAAQEAKPLRVGFIGVGGRGNGLLNTVIGFKDIDIAVICDTDKGNLDRALNAVEKGKGKRPEGLGDSPYAYRKLLQRDDLDAVVIATPCFWHARMFIDCLAAGRNFYGEKPIAITTTEVRALQEARRKAPGVVLQIGCQWASHQARADVVKQVQQGAIGELIEGRFHRHNQWGSLGRWFNDRALSGDWMLEQAVHEFNLMYWVTQKHPIACYAVGRVNVVEPQNKARNVHDFYSAILEYEGGPVIHYTHGWIDPPGFGAMGARFVGTLGGLDLMPATIRLRGKEPIQGQGAVGDTPEHLRNFFEAVRAKKPEAVNCGFDNGIAASYIGLIIRKALDEKRRVTFEELVKDQQPFSPLPKE